MREDPMFINETRLRNIIKEEMKRVLEAVDDDDYEDDWDGASDADDGEADLPTPAPKEEKPLRPPPNFEDPENIDDVAYVIACFCRTWITGTGLKRLKEIADDAAWRVVKDPDGGWKYVKIEDQDADDQRRAAEHLISIFSRVMEYYESHTEDNFVASPQYFLDSLGTTVYRQHPEMGKEIQRTASNENQRWVEGVSDLDFACERISAWLRNTYNEKNKQYSAGYLDAIEIIKSNPAEIEALRTINGSFGRVAEFLKFEEDEDLVERLLGMVLTGPGGAIQAGEILELLKDEDEPT
jgi:hypothetical protein